MMCVGTILTEQVMEIVYMGFFEAGEFGEKHQFAVSDYLCINCGGSYLHLLQNYSAVKCKN